MRIYRNSSVRMCMCIVLVSCADGARFRRAMHSLWPTVSCGDSVAPGCRWPDHRFPSRARGRVRMSLLWSDYATDDNSDTASCDNVPCGDAQDARRPAALFLLLRRPSHSEQRRCCGGRIALVRGPLRFDTDEPAHQCSLPKPLGLKPSEPLAVAVHVCAPSSSSLCVAHEEAPARLTLGPLRIPQRVSVWSSSELA